MFEKKDCGDFVSQENGPKILILDIETSPILVEIWRTGEQYVKAEDIVQDWHTIAWAAKWLDSDEVIYMDQRKAKDITNDKSIMKCLWKLLDEADIIVTKNGKKFDEKRFNARFEEYELGRPSSYKHTDTEKILRKNFYFSSFSLDYVSNKLNLKYKKLKHEKFPGKELWKECIRENNEDAWNEMERYNKHDVLATEELYKRIRKWDDSINFNVYHDTKDLVCGCGSKDFKRNGVEYTKSCKYQRYKCKKCKAPARGAKEPLGE